MEVRTSQKAWRMEVSNPLEPFIKWRPVFEFNDDELTAFQELGKELDQVNNPIKHRIIRNSLE